MTVESLLARPEPDAVTGAVDEGANAEHGETLDTIQTFQSLGVEERLTRALTERGIVNAFPIQALTIADAMAGRDVCGKAKTGSGKTLAFGLPMLQRTAAALAAEKAAGSGGQGKQHSGPARPRGLVLLPTRELAVQVHDVLAPLSAAVGLRIVAIYGGADAEKQVRRLREGVDIMIATPGRLIDFGDRGELSGGEVETLVLDEADRMADMGFMPQVEWVLRRLERTHQTLLFSATLDGAVDRLVTRYLVDPVRHEVASKTQTVSSMAHRFLQVHQMDKVKVAAAMCRAQDKVLVFVRTKRGADRLVEQLEKEGIRVAAIHGDLRQANRERALKDFSSGKLHVLVATDVAARGLHIEAVDLVVHYDPPEDEKAYLHRSGRTARAGSTGVVAMLALWNQVVEAEVIQRRLGMRLPIVEIFSNDPRLADLAGWEPAADEGVL
jgi:superfamily II DNA/RNA helicase